MAFANPKVRKSQYQHYIPRFLLRRFSYPSSTLRNHDKRRNRKQRDKDVVTAVDLGHDIPEFVELPVGRIFGQVDMYKDDSAFSKKNQDRIETKLSTIEGHASRIIAKVADAHKAGKDGVTLSRHDKDLLRKYIFVMQYRSPIFYNRFNHQKAEDYDSDDRTLFLEYMQEHGFQRPLDVWFDNLLKIIDKPMDPAGNWTEDLFNHIYPGDAEWLYRNIRSMYLSFATPSDAGEEFILTNAFGIHEGPVDYSTDPFTGKQTMTAYAEFHVVAVVSPRLVIILRHNLLPEPLEDQYGVIRDNRRWMLAAQMQAHNQPDNATSLLQDLPVARARNSYTVIQDGWLELAKGADIVPRAADKFHFTFFRLESRHVQTINLVLLDQAHNSSYIVFKSKLALRAALDFYLDFPTQTRGVYSLKTITEQPNDPVLLLLKKLESIARLLGSSVKAKYYIDPLVERNDGPPLAEALPFYYEPSFDEVVAQVLETAATDLPTANYLALPMTIMVQVLARLKMTIPTIHALDMMSMADHRPCFPDLVFQAVQKADIKPFTERNKRLLDVDLSVWRHGWNELVNQASQSQDTKLDRSLPIIQSDLGRRSIAHSLNLSPPLSQAVSQDINRHPGEAPVRPQSSFNDAEAAPVWSRRGLRQALDDTGRDVQDDQATSSVFSSPRTRSHTTENSMRAIDSRRRVWLPPPPTESTYEPILFALLGVVFMFYCLSLPFMQAWSFAVFVWRLVRLAWKLVRLAWSILGLVWSLLGLSWRLLVQTWRLVIQA